MDGGVRIVRETELERGWRFELELRGGQAAEMTLSFLDYEYWCHGQVAPERVARAVIEAILTAEGAGAHVPSRFDASTARRWVRDLDVRVRERI